MCKRRKYRTEFKLEAVALARQPGVSCRQVALEIGINPNLLTRWKRETESISGKAFGGSGTARDEEVARPPSLPGSTGLNGWLRRWFLGTRRQACRVDCKEL
jgi:transposase